MSKIIEENGALKKEIETAIREKSLAMKKDLEAKFETIDGVNFLASRVDLPSADAVKALAYALKGALNNLFLVLGAEFDGKPSLTVVVSEDLVKEKGLNAGAIIRDLAKDIQGGGGGQPFFATAGGKDASGLDKAIARAKDFLTK
jgi:alanyl-tRNA synthetase